MSLYLFLLVLHVVSGSMWIGAVFMGAFIDWPAIKTMVNKDKFPFGFIVGQGTRVFGAVYLAIVSQIVTGAYLVYHNNQLFQQEPVFITLKIIALIIMVGLTLYGSMVTWPKLQMATHKEAYHHYKFYMYRAYTVFVSGAIATAIGVMISYGLKG